MLFHKKTAGLVLTIFLFIFSTEGLAESQAPFKDPKAAQLNKKKWKVIDGFRSAKFGMGEIQVLRAIRKDFKITQKKVRRKLSIQKSKVLTITVPKLMAFGGTADIVYILGYKSKKLVQVNIDWGAGVTKNFDRHDVLNAANFLRRHFVKKRYKKKGLVVNKILQDGTTILFRGKDKQNRMVLLKLKNPKIKNGGDKKKYSGNVSLILSYVFDPKKPDVFKSKRQ